MLVVKLGGNLQALSLAIYPGCCPFFGEAEGGPAPGLAGFVRDNGEAGKNVCGTLGRGGRRPQSSGAKSPHLTCALQKHD